MTLSLHKERRRVTLSTPGADLTPAARAKLLTMGLARIAEHSEFERVERADFGDEPFITFVVQDPVFTNLPRGVLCIEVEPLAPDS